MWIKVDTYVSKQGLTVGVRAPPSGACQRPVKLKVLDGIRATLGTNVSARGWGWGVFFFRVVFYVVLLVGSKNKRK